MTRFSYTTCRHTNAGNEIYYHTIIQKQYVVIGNDVCFPPIFGKVLVQKMVDGQWEKVENGIVDSQSEANALLETLIVEGDSPDSVRAVKI